MFYNYYQSDEYNFDSCTAKGVCSIDPTISSLQEVVVMYLKQLSFYTLKLYKKGVTNKVIRENIVNTLAGLNAASDYSREHYQNIILTLYEHLKQSKILYERICKDNNEDPEKLKSKLKVDETFDINTAIKQGEKEFIKKNKLLTAPQRSLFEIMFVLIKNVCINLIELKSFEKDCDDAYYSVLNLLNLMNYKKTSETKLKNVVEKFAKVNYKLVKLLQEARIEAYGEPEVTEVSFSTRPGKSILVSGSNLKELEAVLKAAKNTEIDIYTHGSMIMGHTFPELKKYPQLQGQFGLGAENFILDFATFPGSILMTRNSMQNVDYLYRGRLFSTDMHTPKGVVKIENNNFKPLIKSALEAKGFAKGQIRDSLSIGYNENNIAKKVDDIVDKIKSKDIEHLFIIGILNHTSLQKRYFERLLKIMPKSAYAITLSTYTPSANVFQINSSYDFSLIYKILEELAKKVSFKKFDISVFLTKCDKYAISNMLNLRELGVQNIILSHCSPLLINPSILDAFKEIFDIRMIRTPQEDLQSIIAA